MKWQITISFGLGVLTACTLAMAQEITPKADPWVFHTLVRIKVDADGYAICSDQKKPTEGIH